MPIPVDRTYIAHAILALALLVVGGSFLFLKLGWTDVGTLQALGMLVGIFAFIPAGLMAAYSAITVIATLLRRQPVPRDMLLLPAGFLVSVIWGSVLAELETPLLTVIAYLPLVGYMIMTLALVVRHHSAHRT